jgi:predicted negative regulator of RcsB-dependent stress response
VVAAVVLVIAAGLVWYMHVRKLQRQHDLQDAMELVEAQVGAPSSDLGKTFPTQAIKDAAVLKAFKEVAQKDAGSMEGMAAEYYAGSLEAETTGDIKDAEARLRKVVDNGGAFGGLAKIALARVQYFNGDQSAAVSMLHSLIDKPSDLVSKAGAQIVLAQLLSTNEPKQAKSLLSTIQNPTQSQDIARAIQQLETQMNGH